MAAASGVPLDQSRKIRKNSDLMGSGDSTAMASPQAFRAHSLPPQPDAELETMLSGAPQFRRRRWPWVLGLAVLLTLLIVVSQVLR